MDLIFERRIHNFTRTPLIHVENEINHQTQTFQLRMAINPARSTARIYEKCAHQTARFNPLVAAVVIRSDVGTTRGMRTYI